MLYFCHVLNATHLIILLHLFYTMLNTTTRRYRDFMTACRREAQAWNGDHTPTVNDIIRRVISGGAPRFYTSYDTAIRRVCHYLSGKNTPPDSLKGRMWRDITERVAVRREADPTLSISQAVINVLDEDEAPSFYLSFFSARSTYFRVRALRRLSGEHRIGRRRLL